jgi:hypothetical protein
MNVNSVFQSMRATASGGAAGIVMLFAGAAMADSISPTSFSASIGVGGSATVHKTVTVSAGTATTQADILFLSDTTGSMGSTIASVAAGAADIMTGTASALGNVAWGVADYKDNSPCCSPGDGYTYKLGQAITTNQAAVQTALNAWSAGGGGDTPEEGLYALTQTTDASTGWRAGSQKIVVIFGDATAHDPSGVDPLVTLTTTKLALIAAGVKVIAFDVGCMDCGTGQMAGATGVPAATGGSYNVGLGSDPAQTVIDAITAAFATYSSVCLDTSSTPVGLTPSSAPPCVVGSFDRSVEHTFDFDLTFTGDAPGDYVFPTFATVDGGIVATEEDHITVAGAVPEPFTLAMFGLGLAGLGFARRRRAA